MSNLTSSKSSSVYYLKSSSLLSSSSPLINDTPIADGFTFPIVVGKKVL
jgi:hypothetical protein